MAALGTISNVTDLTPSLLTGFAEAVDDQLTTMLVAGSGVTITHNEGANTFTIDSTGGGGGGFITAVTDTNTVDMTVSGTTLSAVIPTTATPQITRLGVGAAAGASTALTLQAASITTKVLEDTAHGALQIYYSDNYAGLRYDIQHGESGAPVTAVGPTFKVSRFSQITDTVTANGGLPSHACIEAVHIVSATHKKQPVAFFGHVATEATTASTPGDEINADATAIFGHARVFNSGVGGAIGSYFQAVNDVTGAHRKLSAIEGQVSNLSSVDGTWPGTAGERSQGLLLTVGGPSDVIAGVRLANGNLGGRFVVGFGVTSDNPVSTYTFRDEGNAAIAVSVAGGHATAALAVAATAGKVLIGLESGGAGAKTTIQSTDATEACINLLAHASQTGNILQASTSAGTELVAIGATGVLRIVGTAGGGSVVMNEQSANPAAPTQDAALRFYMKADKFVIQFNNAGTTRYFTLDLTQSGATPVLAQSTTGP